MSATSLDLSQIKTDALSAASTFRTLIGLGTGNTPTFLGATLTGGTVTASAPLINATQTWNNAATTFTGILANVTDTASSSSSLLMDLQVGGSSRLAIAKNGNISINQPQTAGSRIEYSSGGINFNNWGGGTIDLYFGASVGDSSMIFSVRSAGAGDGVGIKKDRPLTWGDLSSNPSSRLVLIPDADNVLAQRRTTNAQTFRIYNTFTDSSNYERGKLEWASNVLRIGTEKAGTGSARALELQTDGTTRLTINSNGGVVSSSFLDCTSIKVNGSQVFAEISYLSRLGLDVGSAGGYNVIRLGGTFQNANTLICIGGSSSSFPAIRRNGTALNFRIGDDSADCDITAAALTLSGNLTISTKNIVTDTTTGTKIGTGTTQKLAFWNATPVVQPTAVADATDAASVITQLNALLSRMRTLGLIAT
jgi:hypothetical protein